jgi:hypothetical protein
MALMKKEMTLMEKGKQEGEEDGTLFSLPSSVLISVISGFPSQDKTRRT